MEIYKLQQLWVFFMCALSGGACGFVYDALQALHKCFCTSKKSWAISDILFWLITSAIVYITIYATNNADLRWYELIGLTCGITIYELYLSRYIRRTLNGILRFCSKIFKSIFHCICIPFKLLHILLMPLLALHGRIRTRALYLAYNGLFAMRNRFFSKFRNFCKK